MLILVTYDVNTETAAGRKRLSQVAKKCLAYGQRVQNSVFECVIDAAQLVKLQGDLKTIMDAERDSIRFYNLGNNYKTKVTHFGTKPAIAIDEMLIV
jgi:CRISPR-associated protein Cas2